MNLGFVESIRSHTSSPRLCGGSEGTLPSAKSSCLRPESDLLSITVSPHTPLSLCVNSLNKMWQLNPVAGGDCHHRGVLALGRIFSYTLHTSGQRQLYGIPANNYGDSVAISAIKKTSGIPIIISQGQGN